VEDVGVRQRFVGQRQPWQSGHALLVIPVVLNVVIGALSVAARAFIGWHSGTLFSRNVMVHPVPPLGIGLGPADRTLGLSSFEAGDTASELRSWNRM
jgi:hypothetical protein